MDTAAKERLISQIIWEYTPATVIAKDGSSLSLILHPPTPKEQAEAAVIYSVEYKRAIEKGLSNEIGIINDMILLGKWDRKTDIEIEGLQADIHKIRRGLLDFLFNRTKLGKARSLLRRAESALLKRLSQKHDLMTNSAEAHALICQQRYLIGCITETEDGDLFWASKKYFEDSDDIGVILQLCELFFKQSRIATKFIRELARSPQWRVYWDVAKNTNDLFSGSIVSWSENQRELVHWSVIYDSVYEAYERPSKDIIMDDDLLDSWFIRQNEKSEGRTQANTASKPLKSGRNEEFVMADREGAKQVYNMNDVHSRAQIKARQKLLANQGSIREQDMPDSQRDMRQQLMEKRKKRMKDISHR